MTFLNFDQSDQMSLAKGTVLYQNAGAGPSSLRVDEGRVWLTETNGGEDVVLEKGMRVDLKPNVLTIIEALTDIVVGIETSSLEHREIS